MALQKQWKRNQIHSPGTPAAVRLLENHFFGCLYRQSDGKCVWFLTRQVPSCISSQSPRLHASNPNLSTTDANIPELCPRSPDSPTEVSLLQQDFYRLANNSESTIKGLLAGLRNTRLLVPSHARLFAVVSLQSTIGLNPR